MKMRNSLNNNNISVPKDNKLFSVSKFFKKSKLQPNKDNNV